MSAPMYVDEVSRYVCRILKDVVFCGISVPEHNESTISLQNQMSDNT